MAEGKTPFEMLLCSGGPQEEADWRRGFEDAGRFIAHDPVLAEFAHEVVGRGLHGVETARLLNMPYDAYHEGLWHGAYGEIEVRRVLA